MADTSIQWTDKTWNPVRGCSIVSPGCINCYAMKQAHRFSGPGGPYEGLTKLTAQGPQWTGKVVTVKEKLLEPLSWRKPARVFVNSMSDLFHEDVPNHFIDGVFAVMALAPQHTFQILTKRAERMQTYLSTAWRDADVATAAKIVSKSRTPFALPDERVFDARRVAYNEAWLITAWPLPNVWLGVSCENQATADERIPLLLQTPAAVRWVSAEPLIGPIDFGWFPCHEHHSQCSQACDGKPGVSWVVVGGESGPGARSFDLAWARSIVAQCQAASVPVFVKQVGSRPESIPDRISHRGSRTKRPDGFYRFLNDRKGGDPSEWPQDIRIRQYPERSEVDA